MRAVLIGHLDDLRRVDRAYEISFEKTKLGFSVAVAQHANRPYVRVATRVEIKFAARSRHRRDTCSMAWRCRF